MAKTPRSVTVDVIMLGQVAPGKKVSLDVHVQLPGTETPSNPGSTPTHRVKTDAENGRFDRPKLPMVFVFNEYKVVLTFEWQMYFVAINYGMKANNISHTWNDDVAFCNNSGFQGDHHCRNYILMEDLNNELPKLDKTRICGDARFSMTGDKVLCMNGTNSPLLKPGYSHPQNTQEAFGAFERYLYNPRDNPCYFFPCTTTGADHNAHAWPGAAYYQWYKGGTEPVTWMFMVAPNGEITYPPAQWTNNTPYVEKL